MKFGKFRFRMAMVVLAAVIFTGCGKDDSNKEIQKDSNVSEDLSVEGEIGAFRPVDCGIPSQEIYEYPFLGMNVKLSEEMLGKMDQRDVFVYTQEDYAGENEISYGFLRFSAVSPEQKEEEVMSLDILSWEGALERIGVIGVYQKDQVSQLDTLTECDSHKLLGTSEDGIYEYYLSTNSKGNQELMGELEKSEVTIFSMHELDMSLGYSAFSTDRIDGVENIGTFTTTDVNGNTYTQELFQEYDLTLVNVFATWCSPCVEEMPELEALRKEYQEKGVNLGVVAVVLDARTAKGIDQNAVGLAQTLAKRSGAGFPFLIPDEGNMNGRLTGIESIPESFFVDKNGNIVSDPYIGANSQKGWSEVVEKEFAKWKGAE